MLAEERRFRICEVLARQRTVSATELKTTLGVTAATIRRDLAALEEEGLLVRSHGGAVSKTTSTNFQPSYEALGRTNLEQKQWIAEAAAKLILDGDTVFLEGSTTVYELAAHLLQRNRLTVVTNSPLIVCQLQRAAHINVMCTGGDLQRDIFYLSGLWAQRSLTEIRVDKAVLGISAIDPDYGISTASQGEASIKKQITKIAKERIGLADHSKFGNQGFAYVGPSTDIHTLVTDSGTDQTYINVLRESGVQVIVAGRHENRKPAGRTSAIAG
ncbi:MAG TPA: DeoR/GlpR family DNA-binding transcription regulator [Acidobacteriaceae bacterium]|nr:DeoR/GlpR family DNA-binding transcription regulator [Terriglobia bacterium]HVC91542.1 DeoR/GlpR family DNA-binding transcription regulator [Acidobacteriaceae bacterium]